MQQSVAFKILRTRLKTVPPYSFSGEQFRRQSPGNAFTEANHVGGSQIMEDGDVGADTKNAQNGINFTSWLKQFERVQEQHRAHSKAHSLNRCNSASSKVCHTLFPFPSFRKVYDNQTCCYNVLRVKNERKDYLLCWLYALQLPSHVVQSHSDSVARSRFENKSKYWRDMNSIFYTIVPAFSFSFSHNFAIYSGSTKTGRI